MTELTHEHCMKIVENYAKEKGDVAHMKDLKSAVNVFKKNNILKHLGDPKVAHGMIQKTWKNRKTAETKMRYARILVEHAFPEHKCLISGCTEAEFNQKHYEENILHYYKNKTPEQKAAIAAEEEKQELSLKDFFNYVPVATMRQKLREKLKEITPDNVVKNQMIILLAILFSGDVLLRGDYGTISLKEDGQNRISPDGNFITIGSLSKKTKDSAVITVGANRLRFVKMLIDKRMELGHDYLFMKENAFGSEACNPTKGYIAKAFGNKMEEFLGKRVTLTRFRIYYGIFMSEKDNGNLEYQRKIEKKMNHSYA
ncbi:hypothetical protein HDU89_000958, partial [Geranomyces variabilis]